MARKGEHYKPITWNNSKDSVSLKSQLHTFKTNQNTVSLYSFPIAVVTNYHKLSGLKQHRFIVCRLEVRHRSLWAKIKVLAQLLHFFSGTLWENQFSCLFQLVEAIILFCDPPPLHLQSQQHCILPNHSSIDFSDSDLFCFPLALLGTL